MKAPFSWPGGKSRLLKQLLEHIPEHDVYVEVFSGSAKLLFAKEPSRAEVVNDANGEITNFFRVTKHRAAELAEALEQEITHPERFRELRADVDCSDELRRALRFAYTTWFSYGAKGQHFAAASLKEMVIGQVRRPLDSVRDVLTLAADRLRRVRIEQRDFAELIQRFDSKRTFFYLDPPYVNFASVGQYEALTAARRAEIFEVLAATEGQFLLSFGDAPEIRALAKGHGFRVEEVETRYGLGHTKASREPKRELLITRGR